MRAHVGLFAVLLAVPASAAEVFINGVNVDGLKGQRFEKVNVQLDEQGNVHIEAPGYNVKRVTVGPQQPHVDEAIITKTYFLVTEQSPLGATEFDIDVAINGKVLRTLRSGDEQLVVDVTKHLKPGNNTVLFHARKELTNKEGPKSMSKSHIFRVIIGEGSMSDTHVMIDKPVVTFTRNASEQTDVSQEFSFTTR